MLASATTEVFNLKQNCLSWNEFQQDGKIFGWPNQIILYESDLNPNLIADFMFQPSNVHLLSTWKKELKKASYGQRDF